MTPLSDLPHAAEYTDAHGAPHVERPTIADTVAGVQLRVAVSGRGEHHGHCRGPRAAPRRSPEYRAWCNMRGRCDDTSNAQWADYGGRGIEVCVRWASSPSAFLADMGQRPTPAHTVDRIDNDSGYWCGRAECPDCGPAGRTCNVRWATRTEQCRNKRNNRFITIDGLTRCVAEWCEVTGVTFSAFKERIKRGWDERRALYEPMRSGVGEGNAMSRLTKESAQEIRRAYPGSGLSMKTIGARFGVSESTVASVLKGRTWAAINTSAEEAP